jgi:DNA-binding CsgD family transcriptional regulator
VVVEVPSSRPLTRGVPSTVTVPYCWVMGTIDLARTVGAIERAVTRAATADQVLAGLSNEVSKAVHYDGAMWFGVDPTTLLAVAPSRMEHLDDGYCQPFWHGEFHEHDANQFVDLARQPVPAATLRATMSDRPLRSARYRDFIQPQGYDDELRTVFRVGESTWGVAALFRERGRKAFDERDVAVFAAISSVVAAAIRRHAVTAAVRAPTISDEPGLLLFDNRGLIVSANAAAASWLSRIYGLSADASLVDLFANPTAPDLEAAIPVIPLLAKARAVAAGRVDGQARLRLRDTAGNWVMLHASALAGGTGGDTLAVVVEPAKSADIAPIVIEAYGLTPRERDVVRAIARGSSTPQIATELHLSAHTVRDYIKSVFEKIGVNSRAELVAKLFAEHYADTFHETLVHID